MKRIGIITLYYKSLNYGGTLQSAALVRYLCGRGFDARQISFDFTANEAGLAKNLKRLASRITDPDTPFYTQLGKYRDMFCEAVSRRLFFKQGFAARAAAFDAFRKKNIPATSRVYSDADISVAAADFDAFITGSDIVWHPYLTDSDAFFLSFAPADKPKIAYAASLGVKAVGKSKEDAYRRRLAELDSIAVREASAARSLSRLTDKKIEVVLDPTLLLGRGDYESLASPALIDKPYIFAYLLGGTKEQYRAVRETARKLSLPVVTVPHPGGQYRRRDEAFGDIHFANASPADFLSLVSGASLVLTDSFHTPKPQNPKTPKPLL